MREEVYEAHVHVHVQQEVAGYGGERARPDTPTKRPNWRGSPASLQNCKIARLQISNPEANHATHWIRVLLRTQNLKRPAQPIEACRCPHLQEP